MGCGNCTASKENGWWCERHGCHKTPTLVEFCTTRQEFWLAWEEGKGPGQKTVRRKRKERNVVKVDLQTIIVKYYNQREPNDRTLVEVLEYLDACKRCGAYNADKQKCNYDGGCDARTVLALRLVRGHCDGWHNPPGGPTPVPERVKTALSAGVTDALNLVGLEVGPVLLWLTRPSTCTKRRERVSALNHWVDRVLSGNLENASFYLTQLMGNVE